MARPLGRRWRAEATALPGWIKPQLTKLVDQAPEGPGWLHEIKFDGYRMHARLDRGVVRLLTRTGLDWTHKYPAIGAAVASLAEGTRLEPSVPLLRKALLGVGNWRRVDERRIHSETAMLAWSGSPWPFPRGGTVSSNPSSSRDEPHEPEQSGRSLDLTGLKSSL